jgi:ElaB/YqjD/DUF883 family membrane-anchored ribosome-binding protein
MSGDPASPSDASALVERPAGPLAKWSGATTRIAELKDRVEKRREQLSAALQTWERSIQRHMPAEVVRQQAEERPWRVVVLGFAAGVLIGGLFGARSR